MGRWPVAARVRSWPLTARPHARVLFEHNAAELIGLGFSAFNFMLDAADAGEQAAPWGRR